MNRSNIDLPAVARVMFGTLLVAVFVIFNLDVALAQSASVFDDATDLLEEGKAGLMQAFYVIAIIALIALAIHGAATKNFQFRWFASIAGGTFVVAMGEQIINWISGN